MTQGYCEMCPGMHRERDTSHNGAYNTVIA